MTSIEWMIDELIKKHTGKVGNEYIEIFEKAKEMHKQEIVKSFDEGQEYEYQYHINNAPKFDSETYYQETFVSKGSDDTLKDYHIVEANEMIELPKHDVDKLVNEDVPKLGYCEISDEEIYKGIWDYCKIPHDRLLAEVNAMIDGAKWYREQLKQRNG